MHIQSSKQAAKRLMLFVLISGAMFSAPPSNSVKLKETSGSAQTNRPFTIGRVFAKGEISHFPQPSVSGAPVSPWQADVKTRWRDGSSTCTVTNATNATPIVITCASPHGYQEGEQVTITGVQGNTAANRAWWITPLSPTSFNLHGSVGNGTFQSSGTPTAVGPADGSVSHAVISFHLTLAANSLTQVDFIDSPNPCSSGTQSACYAAAVTKAQLQSWDSGSGPGKWGAVTSLVNGTTKSVDAKAILNACSSISTDITSLSCRYWLAGPVVSQIVVEDRSPARAFDTGFKAGNPIHPTFIIAAYPGWSGLKIDYILENTWVGNTIPQGMQMVDEAYQVVMSKGAPSTAWYTYPASGTFNHWARTRFRQAAWQGTAPGSVWIDYNMPYVTYSGLTYNYDTSFSLPSSYWDPTNATSGNAFSEVFLFNQKDGGKDPNAMGSLTTRAYGDPGAHSEYGLDDRFNVAWMYSWAAGVTDPNARLMENVIAGNSEVLGHVNIHYRENLTGRTFCNATKNCVAAGINTADAYGRPVSIDARPNVWWNPNPNANAAAPAADRYPLSSIQGFDSTNVYTLKGWMYELSHAWDTVYLRYALTGDYYLLEELWFQPQIALSYRDYDVCSYCRMGSWGMTYDENRGSAWAMKFLSRAAFLSPGGTPERLYFREKLANNLAFREGYFGMTTGAFYEPQPGSRWYWSYNSFQGGQANPLAMQIGGECFVTPDMDPTKVYGASQPWTLNFNGPVWAQTADMGFSEARPVANWWFSKHLLHEILDPGYNPFLTGLYYEPVMKGNFNNCPGSVAPGTPFFTTWAEMKGALVPSVQSYADFNYATVQPEWAYPLIALAASSYLPGLADSGLDGQAAYNWMKAHVPNQNLTHLVPRLAIVPRVASVVTLPPVVSRCDVNSDGILNISDLQLIITSAIGTTCNTSADLNSDGRCDIIDVQVEVDSILSGVCSAR